MRFDFCFATYNSEKWLESCLEALTNLEYDKKQLGLYFADNASTDQTVSKLEQLRQKYGAQFGAFEVLLQGENRGFGTASNAAARAGKGNYVFFYNLDTRIFPDALTELDRAIAASDDSFGAFELRQFPYEHPKYYDPVTLETSWSSGACFVLRRDVFEKTGGFDESIFMYAEDVDLSWHLRALGYKIRYVPSAGTWHYTYQQANEEKPMQVAGSLAGNLVLRYKYGTHKDIENWEDWKRVILARTEKAATRDMIHKLVKQAKEHKDQYRRFYESTVCKSAFKPQFLELDYEFARAGAFYENHLPKTQPAFTVVIRTYRRPEVLALTLESLTHQTYKNFKVIVVEDGLQPCAQEVVEKMQDRLDIRYLPLRQAAGRCRAGNIGLQQADTEYVCFLDDDDYFFAEHFEVMACLIEENPDSRMFAAASVEGACQESFENRAKFQFVRKKNLARKELRRLDFFHDNPVPIQAVVFHKELFEKWGGLDEKLDALEDWDMWMRYVSHCEFSYVEKATSIFKVPADQKAYLKRDKEIGKYRKMVYEKMADYKGCFSAQEIYGLFWNPDQVSQTLETLEDHKENLRKSAQEICSCTSWRVTAPVRFVFNVVRYALDAVQLLVNFVLGWIGKIFYGIFIGWSKLADKVGPPRPDFHHASAEQLRSFILIAKRSLSMKAPVYFKNLFKK